MSVEDDHREGDLFAAYSEGLAEGAAAERAKIVAELEALQDALQDSYACDCADGYDAGINDGIRAALTSVRSASPVAAVPVVVGQPDNKPRDEAPHCHMRGAHRMHQLTGAWYCGGLTQALVELFAAAPLGQPEDKETLR